MNKPLYCIVAPSGAGKTTVQNILVNVGGYKAVESYTTRAPRFENETGHIFISDEEFNQLEDIIAFVEYNNHRYAATKQQVNECDLYVIDPLGVENLMEKYTTDRQIVIFYFKSTVHTRIDRMLNRHDSDTAIVSRLYTDEEYDWEDKLSKTVWNYKHNENRNIEMVIIDANKDIESVVRQVTEHINVTNSDVNNI